MIALRNFDISIVTIQLCFLENFPFFLLVCIDVKFVGVENTLSWRIGHCNSGKYQHFLGGSLYINTYRCCLTPGKHILTCKAGGQFHWRQGYVLLQGRKYCQDFIGFTALRRITIFRKQNFYMLSNNIFKVFILWLYIVKKYIIMEYTSFQLRRC